VSAAVLDQEIAFWPSSTLVDAIRSRDFSATDLVGLYVDRIERVNPAINAVVTCDADRALAEAASIDQGLARGERVGPLAGLPMTIKDVIEVAGMRCTAGAVELRDHVPARDAPAVAMLRAAGAIILGKTNTPAFCSGDSETNNELFGVTNNPWNVRRSVGGSSGGSGAAVAAGLTGADIGTDIGGSVRIPSHFCGVYGFKPSYGVVPQHGYVSYVGGGRTDVDMNHFGPIARSPADLQLLLDVVAAPLPYDSLAWSVALPPPRHRAITDYRIGYWFDEPDCPIESEYRTILDRTADALRDEGARVRESHPSVGFEEQTDLWFALVSSASAPGLPAELAEAAGGSHLQWLRRDERRQEIRHVWHAWFEQHDALLCPVILSAAHEHDLEGDFLRRTIEVDGMPRSLVFDGPRWCGLVNVIGFPSCVVPVGRTNAGLPVGVQIVADHLRDRDALHLASCMEQLIGGFEPPPLHSIASLHGSD
jgi:amidase